MSPELFAQLLNGREYRQEIASDEEATAKAAGLVVVFGSSDDRVELRGAITDELGNGEFRVCSTGLMPTWQSLIDWHSDDESAFEDYFKRKAEGFKTIDPMWCPNGSDGPSWAYKTDIPHAKFTVMEGEEVFCVGIVFALKDAVPA